MVIHVRHGLCSRSHALPLQQCNIHMWLGPGAAPLGASMPRVACLHCLPAHKHEQPSTAWLDLFTNWLDPACMVAFGG